MHMNWGKSVDFMEGGFGVVQGLAGRLPLSPPWVQHSSTLHFEAQG